MTSFKYAFVTLFLLQHTSVALAAEEKSPYEKFSSTRMFASTVRITWKPVDDVVRECNQESRRRGRHGFKSPMQACAFWDADTSGQVCTIITAKQLNYWTLGHETRHCFQGEWHGGE